MRETTPAGAPLTLTRWEIRPRDGAPPLRGDLRVRPDHTPDAVIVLCHGFKGFKDWGFFPAVARAVAHRGYAAVSFNFSRGGIGADGVDFSALDLFAQNTHSRNVEEIHTVLDAVASGGLLPRRPRRIGLFGHSRGGGEAVLAAAADPRVDALVTWAAISSVERWSEDQQQAWRRGETVSIPNARTGQQMPMGPGFWEDIAQNRERLNIARAGASLDIPWLIVHGEEDTSVAAQEARVLHQAASDGAELLLIPAGGHTFGAVHPFAGTTPELQAAADATLRWFEAHLE
ncbi:alpha/beta hydrolase [soil metagenome]